jgi:hypothetical protein
VYGDAGAEGHASPVALLGPTRNWDLNLWIKTMDESKATHSIVIPKSITIKLVGIYFSTYLGMTLHSLILPKPLGIASKLASNRLDVPDVFETWDSQKLGFARRDGHMLG